MNRKTLGQIAYEASPDGGQQNWGAWTRAPDVVRRVHEAMAQAVKLAVLRRVSTQRRRESSAMKTTILLALLCATPAQAQLRPDSQAAIAQELRIMNQRENFRQLREYGAAERARVLGEQERSERRYQPLNHWTMPEDDGGDDE